MTLYGLPELYDAQYERYRDDLSFYTRLAEDYGSPVLELGAGTGRVSIALAKAGQVVTGLELSEPMLAKAREHKEREKLGGSLSLLQADMRDFDLGQTFPLVIAPFNVLMHLYTVADQDRALAAARRHVREDGVFACDLYNPHFTKLETLRREDEWAQLGGDEAELFIYQTHNPDKQVLTSTYYLDKVGDKGTLTRQKASVTQRYYTRFELERALAQAGFSHVRFYGHFDRRPYRKAEPHLIALAKR